MNSKTRKICIVFMVVLLICIVMLLNKFDVENICSQIIGVLLSAVITVIITALLLNSQTEKNIEHDCKVKIFEKKQDVYHDFINEIQNITNSESVNNEETVKKLILQLAMIQMHAKPKVSEEITKLAFPIIANFSKGNKSRCGMDMYPKTAGYISNIVSVLKNDLYNLKEHPVNEIVSAVNSVRYEKIVDFSMTLAGLSNKELRTAKKMIELHAKWWELFIEEMKNIRGDLDYIFYLEDYSKNESSSVKEAAEHFDKNVGNVIFSVEIGKKDNLIFYYYMSININGPMVIGFETNVKEADSKWTNYLPEGYAPEGFGDPGIGARIIPEQYDIDFYSTNTNYYIFACEQSDEARKRIIAPFVKQITDDILEFCKKADL